MAKKVDKKAEPKKTVKKAEPKKVAPKKATPKKATSAKVAPVVEAPVPTLNPVPFGKHRLIDLLTTLGFAPHRSEASMMCKQGKVAVNGETVLTNNEYMLDDTGIELTVGNNPTVRAVGG